MPQNPEIVVTARKFKRKGMTVTATYTGYWWYGFPYKPGPSMTWTFTFQIANPPLTDQQLHDRACRKYSMVGRIATYGGGASLIGSLVTKANPYVAAASAAATVVGVGAQAAADLSGC